jgi:hypothetical protein
MDAISGGAESARFSTQGASTSIDYDAAAANSKTLSFTQIVTGVLTGKYTSVVQRGAVIATNGGETGQFDFVPVNSNASTALDASSLSYVDTTFDGAKTKLEKFETLTRVMTLMIASRMNCTSTDRESLDVYDKNGDFWKTLVRVSTTPTRMGNAIIYDKIIDWPAGMPDMDMCPDDRDAYVERNKCRGLIMWSKDVRIPSDGVAMESCVGSSVYENYEIETKTKRVDLKAREIVLRNKDAIPSLVSKIGHEIEDSPFDVSDNDTITRSQDLTKVLNNLNNDTNN